MMMRAIQWSVMLSTVVVGCLMSMGAWAGDCKDFEDHAESECNAQPGCKATKVRTNLEDCKTEKCRTEGKRAADCERVEASKAAVASCKDFEDHAASECNAQPGCAATKVSTNLDDCKTETCRTEGKRAADCERAPTEGCKAFEDHAESECNAQPGCKATKVSTNLDDCKTEKCRTEGKRAADCE